MSDYIKREDAIKAFDPRQRQDWYTPWIVETLNDLPSADVAPVRHGHWIEYGENKDGTHNMRCSKCGAGLKSKGHANSYYTKHKYRYCNKCGARMDGESDD